jgi:hypothetical protein
MQIIAVYDLQADTALMAQELASILGTTPYEARSRVNSPGGGPSIVASFANHDQAMTCVERLHDADFKTICIDSTELENDQNRFIVQRLSFNPEGLQLWDQDGEPLKVYYADRVLLLRGAGIISSVKAETTTKKKFAVGRALATGGLVMRKKVNSTTTSTTFERQPFCHIYVPDLPAIVLRQDILDYTALGSECKLSRAANFTWICSELRRLCRDARWDERLQTRPGLAQLLGPVFNPETDLDLAITMLVKSYLSERF